MLKPVLTYVYDPLCGWCFGFHPVIEKLAKRFEHDLHIHVIPGGLAVDKNTHSISEGYSELMEENRRIEKITGAKFGENFYLLAEEGSYFFSSESPSIAQTVVNQLAPDHALGFAVNMQKAFFTDGKTLNKWETFEMLIKNLPLDTGRAAQLYESEQTRQKTYETFRWCKTHRAVVFPTLLLSIGNETGVISKGYRPYDTIEPHLHHLMNNFRKIQT